MIKRVFLLFAVCIAMLPARGNAAEELRPFEIYSLNEIVEQHKGRPFVLFVWSLDCVYCQASLDHLAEAKRNNRAISIVTVSTDAAADAQAVEMIQKRLKELRLAGNAWAFGSTSPEKLKYSLDPKWFGEKPRSYWFNAQGKRTAYSGVLTPDVIDKLYRQVSS